MNKPQVKEINNLISCGKLTHAFIICEKSSYFSFLLQSYPVELQTRSDHFENPLAPYESVITYNDLSTKAKAMLQQNGDKSQRYSQKKLINDFRKRVDYVTHVENLQFYLKHGMKLEKVTEIISFSQSQFAKKFVKETTQKRHSTQSKVEKAMWKFFNNVLFGKSLQDGGKNINVDIMWKSRKSNAKCRSNNFRGRLILDEETVAISSTPPEISRFMAFAVGFSILEFSKLEMYKAWYEKICPQFPTAELCTSDTDSFLFSIKSENVYEDLKKIPNFWDFSTLPTEHKHYNGKTANKLGLFKLEVGADKIFACACRFFSESIPKKMMLLKN